MISTYCDSAILVIGAQNIPYRDAQEVVEQLKKSGCNMLGVVLNNAGVRSNKSRYAYRGKRGYYRYYSYGSDGEQHKEAEQSEEKQE